MTQDAVQLSLVNLNKIDYRVVDLQLTFPSALHAVSLFDRDSVWRHM